jgi:hypothetical protein
MKSYRRGELGKSYLDEVSFVHEGEFEKKLRCSLLAQNAIIRENGRYTYQVACKNDINTRRVLRIKIIVLVLLGDDVPFEQSVP